MPRNIICSGCGKSVPEAQANKGRGPCCPPPSRRANRRGSARQKVWDSAAHKRARRICLANADYTCQRCGHHDPSGRTLDAHHTYAVDELIDAGLDPTNPDEYECLCDRCHGREEGRRRSKPF